MSRFARLVDLKKLREEADGLAYAQVLARIEGLHQKIQSLNQETDEGHRMAIEQVVEGHSPGPRLLDDFLRGQEWRVQNLEVKIRRAQIEAEAAKKVWHASRVKLKQAESMAEKEEAQRQKEKRLEDKKELDMIGIVQRRFRS